MGGSREMLFSWISAVECKISTRVTIATILNLGAVHVSSYANVCSLVTHNTLLCSDLQASWPDLSYYIYRLIPEIIVCLWETYLKRHSSYCLNTCPL